MDIMRMSAKEVVLINVFAQLAEETFKAEKIIKEQSR